MTILFRRRPRRRIRLGVVSLPAVAALAAILASSPGLLLNRSPSEPQGLYIRTGAATRSGQIIAFRTPAAAFPYADHRMAYLHHRPLLKAVAAGPGDLVCTLTGMLVINGRPLAPVASVDRQGRALPRWRDCRRMGPSELFVFSARVPNSFDSRYYGPVQRADVLGSYQLLAPFTSETL